MRGFVRTLALIVLFLLIAAAGIYFMAGRAAGPSLAIAQPQKVIGISSTLDIVVDAPGGQLTRLAATLEQDGQRHPIFALDQPGDAQVRQEGPDRVRITRQIGRRSIPQLKTGGARIEVTATRPVLYGLRETSSTVSRDVQVRLTPPRVAVVSTHHYVNHGGSELVVYTVTPPEVESGVQVGDAFYPGFPASGAGIANAPAPMKVAFFALLYDQDLGTPIDVVARDEAGNQARVRLDHRPFPKPFRRSRIDLDQKFLQKVVPEIAEQTPELGIAVDANNPSALLPGFLKINGELRRKNAETIAAIARKTAAEMLWQGPFVQLSNSQVEASFADHRTYVYEGKEVDQQVHLGFDLAVTANVPIVASNRGKVVHADYLGIYGNCVIIDHGLGIHSLYAHLSSIDVKADQMVEKNATIGRSGMTGLAGGDHLHFTMLVHGRAVSPVDWWSTQWIEDRITRKLRDASGGASPAD
jgi:murein DD-endopeptidase MepM/ murein hydrolase activator NlpD